MAVAVQRQARADKIGLYWNFALAAIDQDREYYLFGPAVVEYFIHRRANRSAGLQHVVDQDNGLPVDVGRQV